MKSRLTQLVVGGTWLLAVVPAVAHHSFAAEDDVKKPLNVSTGQRLFAQPGQGTEPGPGAPPSPDNRPAQARVTRCAHDVPDRRVAGLGRFDRECLALAWVMSGVGDAQVLCGLDPRLPRIVGGQPNLTAVAPKTRDGQPDLSGIWHVADARYLNNLGADAAPPLTPAGAALYRERQAAAAKDRPAGWCLPCGVPASLLVRGRP